MPPRKSSNPTVKSKAKSLANSSTSKPKDKNSNKSSSALSAEALGNLVKKNPQLIQLLLASNADASNEAAQEQRRTAHKHHQPHGVPADDDEVEEIDEAGDDEVDYERDGERDVDGSGGEEGGSDEEYQDPFQDKDEDAEDGEEDQESDVEDSPLKNKRSRKRAAPRSGEPTAKRQRTNKAASANPAVTIGKSVTLLRPHPRPRKKQTSVAPTTTAVEHMPAGAPPFTPARSRTVVTANGQAAAPPPAAPFTPYSRHPNAKKKVLESQLTSPTRGMLSSFKESYRVYMVTENGFPSLDETVSYVKARLPDALRLGKKPGRIGRATDKTYELDLAVLLYGKASDIRNHLVAVAKSVVPEYYDLEAFESKGLRRKEVRRLLAKCAFVHSDTQKASVEGLFEHPAIRTVIQRAFFTSSKRAFNVARLDNYKTQFDPFPRQLLALAATALWCALDQWRTGKFVQVNFEGEAYKPRYQKLLAMIAEVVDDEPDLQDYFAVQCSGWYAEASAAGIFASDSDSDDVSEDDAEITARNRAAMRAAARAVRAAREAQETEGAAGTLSTTGPGASTV